MFPKFMESLLSILHMHWDHEPGRAGSPLPAANVWWVARLAEHRQKARTEWRALPGNACWSFIRCSAFNVRCSMFPSSWKASFRFFTCIGTMNPVGRAVPCPPRTWWVARLAEHRQKARTEWRALPGKACWQENERGRDALPRVRLRLLPLPAKRGENSPTKSRIEPLNPAFVAQTGSLLYRRLAICYGSARGKYYLLPTASRRHSRLELSILILTWTASFF